jgi:hypothetical protein
MVPKFMRFQYIYIYIYIYIVTFNMLANVDICNICKHTNLINYKQPIQGSLNLRFPYVSSSILHWVFGLQLGGFSFMGHIQLNPKAKSLVTIVKFNIKVESQYCLRNYVPMLFPWCKCGLCLHGYTIMPKTLSMQTWFWMQCMFL